MAVKMTKRGQADNEVAYEFMCDSVADLTAINPEYATMGSVSIIINDFEVYMANSQHQWINIGGDGGES